jgi:hypothetical protein
MDAAGRKNQGKQVVVWQDPKRPAGGRWTQPRAPEQQLAAQERPPSSSRRRRASDTMFNNGVKRGGEERPKRGQTPDSCLQSGRRWNVWTQRQELEQSGSTKARATTEAKHPGPQLRMASEQKHQ